MSTRGEISGGGKRYYAEPRTHKRHDMDFYIEPRWTVEVLLDAEKFNGPVWDPACGSGTIPTAVRDRGLICRASDAADRSFGPVHDFLMNQPFAYTPVNSIITNPPYGLAAQFVERALEHADEKVAVLVQSKFPYSQRRYDLFTKHPVARLYFLSSRPSMPPGEKLLAGTVTAKGGKMDYLWIVFEHGHKGPPTTHWLRRPEAK